MQNTRYLGGPYKGGDDGNMIYSLLHVKSIVWEFAPREMYYSLSRLLE